MDPGSESEGRGCRHTVVALVLHVALATVLLWPALTSGDRIGGKDWNAFLGEAQAEVTTLVDYGQFPAWNPWRRGGQVAFAQPESMFLSPVTPVALLVGANAAFKLWLLPCFVAAGLGLFVLAGDLGLRGAARLVPGLAFVGASCLPLYVNGGLPNWLFGMAILPWLVWASRRAATSRCAVVLGGLLFALLLFCGSVHHFVFFPIVLAIEATARALRERKLRPLLATAALGIVGVALSLVRLVPLLELFSEFPRRLDSGGRFISPLLAVRSLLLPHPDDFNEARHVLRGGSSLYWVDCGAYVGPIVALLAVIALVAALRRAWPFALLGATFLWLAFGSSVEPSLWDALHQLPVYASMQAPERFMGYVAFAIALLAGFGAERVLALARRVAPRLCRVAPPMLVGAVVVPLAVIHASITRGAFPSPPPSDLEPATLFHRSAERPPFKQGRYEQIVDQWGGPLYEAVLCNAGNPDGQWDVPSIRATKAEQELDYRGEAFLAGSHGEVKARFTPNRIEVEARVDADDVLMINQDFFPGWRDATSGRRCESKEGLIALPLAAGTHTLALEFAPATIPVGALLTASALAIALWWWRNRRHGPALPLFAARSDRVSLGLLSVMVVQVVVWHATRTPAGALPLAPPWREVATTVRAGGDPAALQRAVDGAAPGAVLRLGPENYGDVVIHRGLTLVADPPGTTWLASVRIEELPAGETVTLLDVALHAVLPIEARGPDAPPGWVVRRCAGTVIVQGHGPAYRENGEAMLNVPRKLVVEESGQVLFFDTPFESATVRASRLHLARCRLGVGGASAGVRSSLHAEESAVVLNHCDVPEPASPFVLDLRSHSTVRSSGQSSGPASGSPFAAKCDGTSSNADLDTRGFSLWLTQRYGDGKKTRLLLHGPPNAKGMLVVAHAPELVPLKGKNLGQLRATRFDGHEQVLPFELSPAGELEIPVVAVTADARPGDGWFFQAFLPDAADAKNSVYTVMDGGLCEMPAR